MEESKYQEGTFCWIDLATTDVDASKKFYNKLFGWESQDFPMPDGSMYSMMQINGINAGGLYKLNVQQEEMHVPPHWMPYVGVGSAENTMSKVEGLGGNVVMGAMDVGDNGRMGILADPDGAFLSVWEPKGPEGGFLKYAFGGYCWSELGTRQKEKVEAFHNGLFGWSSETKDMGGMEYTTFSKGETMAAGLYTMPPELEGVPSHWLSYFMIENIDKSLETATAEGAEIMMPKMFVPEVGHIAVIKDPQGAVIGIMQGVEQ